MSTLITEPGVYDLDETTYHTAIPLAPALGRALSVSSAKTLLRSPARFLHERDHGRPPKDAFDRGSLIHELILRAGDDRLRVVDAYDWRSKAAQEARKAAHAERLVPIHRGDLLDAGRVARAVRRNALASAVLTGGEPEKSLVWVDSETGVTCKGRVDYVHPRALVDVKTCAYGGSDPVAFAKSAANFDYPMQAAHYSDGWEAITGQRLPFLFVVVEVEEPYLVEVYQLSPDDLDTGRARMAEALALYADYESNGYPDQGADIQTLTLPGWYGRTN